MNKQLIRQILNSINYQDFLNRVYSLRSGYEASLPSYSKKNRSHLACNILCNYLSRAYPVEMYRIAEFKYVDFEHNDQGRKCLIEINMGEEFLYIDPIFNNAMNVVNAAELKEFYGIDPTQLEEVEKLNGEITRTLTDRSMLVR